MHRHVHLDRIQRSRLSVLTAGCLAALLLTVWTVNASAQDVMTQDVVVTAATTVVKDGERIVGRVNRGQRFQVLKTNGDWYLVELTVDGATTKGWIHGNDVRMEDAPLIRKPQLTAAQGERLNQALALQEKVEQFYSAGEYRDAVGPAEGVRDIYKELVGEMHPYYASSLNRLATLHNNMGDYPKAESLLIQTLGILKKSVGEMHPWYAFSLHNLALLHEKRGDYAKAESLLVQTLDIKREAFGESHPSSTSTLGTLATLYTQTGDFAKAEQLYVRVLDIYKKTVGGESHPDYARSLHNLAILYEYMRDHAKAEQLNLQAVDIFRKTLGEAHPDYARSLNTRASLYDNMGDYAKAEPLYLQAADIHMKTLGEAHPDYATSLNDLAVMLFVTNERQRDAVTIQDKSRRAARMQVDRVLPGLSDQEQLRFLNSSDRVHRDRALSMGLADDAHLELATLSAGWLLNSKAVGQDAVSQRTRLGRDSRDPKIVELVQELESVRARLAKLTLTPPTTTNLLRYRSKLAELNLRERELSKVLGQARGEVVRDDPWVEVDEVRRSIPDSSVLVDIARFQVRDFQASDLRLEWQEPHYVAWIVPPTGQGEIKIIDLGKAEAIEDAVRRVRTGLDDPTKKILAQGEPEIEQEVSEPLKQLASLVLDPLLAEISEVKHLILSPDASLWLVPWAALPLKDGRYAVEEYRIHYVISGRDLVTRKQHAQLAASRPLIMADPDFDLDPSQAKAETLALLDTSLALRSSGSMDKLKAVRRLPATATEAKEITPNLRRYTQAEPRVYTGAQALEGVFKAIRSPKVVTLSTHGFFFSDQETKHDDRIGMHQTRPAVLTVDGKALENPMLRCGLLFAGCNQRKNVADGQDDGVLTGVEIVGTDLRGTELVVLSACETGIGEVRNGEGVAGLRQAFQLAGARSVMASLWSVPDVATAQLMRYFFDDLADGQTKADALRNSQLARIASRRKRSGAAHPFFWAAFTLTGY